VIASVGTLELDRNPTGLWQALRLFLQAHPEMRDRIELHFVGKVDGAVFFDTTDLSDLIRLPGYVSHKDALTMMRNADLLLLPLNQIDSANTKGRIPGKLFEYIAMEKPILMLGDISSDAGKIIAGLHGSWCVDNQDADAILKILEDLVIRQSHNGTEMAADASHYQRRTLTSVLASLLDKTKEATASVKSQ
jgi:hypothetical protein